VPTPFLFITDPVSYPALACPICGDDNTHIDDAYVAGRDTEDGSVTQVRIDSRAQLHREVIPITWGRRHSIGVGGYCEGRGHRFVIEFLQHKGATLMEVRTDRAEHHRTMWGETILDPEG
jgi:hypothetical protein